MAVEKDFELLDDFLSNRLNESDRAAFENKIESDPELKQELKVQRDVTQGIRNARIAELKSMLNNVPVPPVSSPTSLLIKAGTWTVVTGLLLTGAYVYFTSEEEKDKVANTPVLTTQPSEKASTSESEKTEVKASESNNQTEPVTTTASEKEGKEPVNEAVKPKGENPNVVTSPVKKPDVKAYDPTAESEDETSLEVQKYEQEQLAIISKAFVTSSMEVETINFDKQYKFHYVFKGGKLVLYGAFEKNLYEILEFINADKKTVVLFYKTNYYLLDINKSSPTLLTPIKDKALLKKLSQYRAH